MNAKYELALKAANAARAGNDWTDVTDVADALRKRAKKLVGERKEMCRFIAEKLVGLPIAKRDSQNGRYYFSGAPGAFVNFWDAMKDWSNCHWIDPGDEDPYISLPLPHGTREMLESGYSTLDELIQKKRELDHFEKQNTRIDKFIVSVLEAYGRHENRRNEELAKLVDGADGKKTVKIVLTIEKE